KQRVLERAVLALQNGLAGKARDMLLESDVSTFGAEGTALELELLLRTGRAREVREWAGAEQEEAGGTPSYRLLRAEALGAVGDYALAEAEFVELARAVSFGDEGQGSRPRELMALRVGQALLDEQPGNASTGLLLWKVFRRVDFLRTVPDVAQRIRREADVN